MKKDKPNKIVFPLINEVSRLYTLLSDHEKTMNNKIKEQSGKLLYVLSKLCFENSQTLLLSVEA